MSAVLAALEARPEWGLSFAELRAMGFELDDVLALLKEGRIKESLIMRKNPLTGGYSKVLVGVP